MAEDKIVELATKQLEAKAKQLKWEVEKAIDDKVESIKSQLTSLSEMNVPTDMLELYLKHGGKLWTSKRVYLDGQYGFSINVGGRNILYPQLDSKEPEFKPPTGTYRLVVIAIPSELPEGAIQDEYHINIRR